MTREKSCKKSYDKSHDKSYEKFHSYQSLYKYFCNLDRKIKNYNQKMRTDSFWCLTQRSVRQEK